MKPAPFDLPEGMAWREITDRDREWLAAWNRDPEQCVAVAITIRIRRTSDGLERDYVDNYPAFVRTETREKLIEGIQYNWGDGNFGCDCNRGMDFARAGGEPDPDAPCGGTAYRVVAPSWLADDREVDDWEVER